MKRKQRKAAFAIILMFLLREGGTFHLNHSTTRVRRSTYVDNSHETNKICEDSSVSISCYSGTTISIKNVFYGTRGYNPCGDGTNCGSYAGTGNVQSRCNGRPSCRVEAANSLLTDPCVGDKKYMRISYDCRKHCSYLRPYPPHCAEIDCTSKTNYWCTKCAENLYFKLVNRHCRDKCSSRNRWCWPGTCGSSTLASDCNCMDGFRRVVDSNNAMCQPTTTPKIETCMVSAVSPDGTKALSNIGPSTCTLQHDFYGRFQVEQFRVDVDGMFEVVIKDEIKSRRPAFVPNEVFGVTDVYIHLNKLSTTGSTTLIRQINLQTNPSHDVMKRDFSQVTNITLNVNLQNAERLCLTIFMRGGGFLTSKQLDNSIESHVAYTKTEATNRTLCYIYDSARPEHCSKNGMCRSKPLELSTRLTNSRNLHVTMDGWVDPFPPGRSSLASGVESYLIEVYEVIPSNAISLMRDRASVGKWETNKTSIDIELPEKNPMLYAILLEVKDFANNVQHARGFVLYDNTSAITMNTSAPLIASTAYNETGYRWQTDHEELCYTWTNRFYNEHYKKNNPLRMIREDSYKDIIGGYDQIVGDLPVNGTDNINGVTRFYYSLMRNDVSIMSDYVTSERLCTHPKMADGDVFTLKIQATDIMNHTLNDSVSVFIDRSAPEITDMWLTKEGTDRLFVHHSTDLSKLSIQFKAFDVHSGIRVIKWAFGLYENQSVLIEKAAGVTHVDQIDNTSSSLYCPKIGNCSNLLFDVSLEKLATENKHLGHHNRRYYFTIEAMNNAYLRAFDHLDILVDDSPPEVGVVLEGPVRTQDIDYTSTADITIHWHDFIDHESGIKQYKVALGSSCLDTLNQLEIGNHNDTVIDETEHTSIKLAFPNGEGRYFVSIIAYNNAMSPSKVVCSDGIVFDTSSPSIVNVSLKHGRLKESVGCYDGVPWLIQNKLVKVPLNGDICSSLCNNTSNDDMLKAIPLYTKSSDNITDLSDFICKNVPRYSDHVIYIPSDLFDLSWEIHEDLSQLSDVYVGFGKDRSTVNSPDIQDYTKVHHPTRYIQHHPGLIGEDPFFIFLRVVNRAGLQSTIQLGPVLADETPPVCPQNLQPVVEGTKLVIKWKTSETFDTEQVEEIGQVMFRFGTGDNIIAPFLEWNIKNHGGECGTNVQCLRYPIRILQRYDTMDGLEFYAQLHFYNYAGHYCSISTLPFYLPSLFPPRPGVVLDVLPNSLSPHRDVDVTFDADKFCVAWSGFNHHENVKFQVGLGNTPQKDDALSFSNVYPNATSFLCKDFALKTDGQKYHVAIKASCSGGTTLSSSDGFIALNSTTVLSSIRVYHGDKCATVVQTRLVNETSYIVVKTKESLMLGETYSLFAPVKITLDHDRRIITLEQRRFAGFYVVVFMPLDNVRSINITDSTIVEHDIHETDITVYKCNPFQKSQTSNSVISSHWIVDNKFSKFVTHFTAAICKYDKSKCEGDVVYRNVGKSGSYNFTGQFKTGFYKILVKPCFQQKCLTDVSSDVFYVADTPRLEATFTSQATVHGNDLDLSVIIDEYLCSTNELALMYRWAVFADDGGQRPLSGWKIVLGKTSKIEDDRLISSSVLPYKHGYMCVEPICTTGIRPKQCLPIKYNNDPNTFDKDIVYDLNLNDAASRGFKKYQNTVNIGSDLLRLQTAEMDFADPNVQIGGLIVGRPATKITWYLTSKREVPTTPCSMDKNCLYSTNTTGGFVDFHNPFIKDDQIFYICAVSSEFRLCSNGFLVDRSYPEPGSVSMDSHNGYVIDGSQLKITWGDFAGNKEAVTLGYPSDILCYEYALGTNKGYEDILPFTSSGLSMSAVIEDLDLQPGQAYYATVRAFNHVNQTVDAFSNHVIFDPSPPNSGVIEVKGHFNGYISGRTITLHWFGIEDPESGISRIEVGLGSHNDSDDVVGFRDFVDVANFQDEDAFQDGHIYYAILRATSNAGIQSYTVSLPFIIDSSPPHAGHVMEIDQSKEPKKDIDYQRNSNSISVNWYGFDDPHSKITHYRVALGTNPNDDDVIRFRNVGLRTSTTFNHDFTHGPRYYTSVMACNSVDLCSTATSNGIIIDTSPPVPGLVVVGDPGKHSRYQSNGNAVHITWVGFDDPHSGIDHFEVCIGTAKHFCDVIKPTNVLLASSILKSGLNMSEGKEHFVTVTACNKINMCVQRSSESFIVDSTAPLVFKRPYIQNMHTGKYKNRTVISDPSLLKVMWKFSDEESPIIRISISVFSTLDTHVPVDDIVLSAVSEYTIQLPKNQSLRQGDIYSIKVTVCNAADLCTTSFSDEILVDSSPPQMGGFNPPMMFNVTDTGIVFHVSWYGFYDVESDIRYYFLSVGNSYSGTQFIDNVKILPNENDDVMSIEVTSAKTDLPDFLIFTVWAVNNAGLASLEAKVTVDVVPSTSDKSHGSLIIQKHSCNVFFCNEECTKCVCTCGVIGRKCATVTNYACPTNTTLSESIPPVRINISLQANSVKPISTASSMCISSTWTNDPKYVSILRYEYSFGINGSAVGEGIYNLSTKNAWHDVGKRQNAFYCLPTGELSHNTHYVAYVRAWVSQSSFVTATSLPMLVDLTPPVIHKRHPIQDSPTPCTEDVDYITSNTTMYGCWEGVFSDDESGIAGYIVALGTSPGVDDIVPMTKIGLTTHARWAGVNYEPGTKYYTTVIAINENGLQTELSSDGFLLDDTPPTEGVVFNTEEHRNTIYESTENPLYFSWHGFDDEHSYIDSFFVAFEVNSLTVTSNGTLEVINVGIANHALYPGKLLDGDTITALVKAVDAAGHESQTVRSQPITIDNTPPMSFECSRFGKIEHFSILNINKTLYTIDEQISTERNDLIKIQITVDEVEVDFMTYVTIGDMVMSVPFVTKADGSVTCEYDYLADDRTNVSIQLDGLRKGATVDVKISKCSRMEITEELEGGITVHQISKDQISVCVQAIDAESGIRQVSISVGSTEGGQEIAVMRRLPLHHHDVIHGNFTHGMPVFVTAIVENHAGMSTKFSAQPLVIDMTPPILTRGNVTASFVEEVNKTHSVISASWNVRDDGSLIEICQYCLGSTQGMCDLVGLIKTGSLFGLTSDPLLLPHGSLVYVTVHCFNSLQLTGSLRYEPVVVSYRPPNRNNSEVTFINDASDLCSNSMDFHSVSFYWNGFSDPSEIHTYYTGIGSNNNQVQWNDMDKKNYCRKKNLQTDQHAQYVVYVRAENNGGFMSDTVNKTLVIDCRKPTVTGHPIEIKVIKSGIYKIMWNGVFGEEPHVTSFEVSVGSLEGSSDLFMPTPMRVSFVEIDFPEDVNELHVVLIAFTTSGQSITYRQTVVVQ